MRSASWAWAELAVELRGVGRVAGRGRSRGARERGDQLGVGLLHRGAHVDRRRAIDARLELHHRQRGDLGAGGRGGGRARASRRDRHAAARRRARRRDRSPAPARAASRPRFSSWSCFTEACSVRISLLLAASEAQPTAHREHDRQDVRGVDAGHGNTPDSLIPGSVRTRFQEGQETRPGAMKARWRPVPPRSLRCEKKRAGVAGVAAGHVLDVGVGDAGGDQRPPDGQPEVQPRAGRPPGAPPPPRTRRRSARRGPRSPRSSRHRWPGRWPRAASPAESPRPPAPPPTSRRCGPRCPSSPSAPRPPARRPRC